MKKDPVAVGIPIVVQSDDSLDKALYSTTNIRSYRGVPSRFEQSHVSSKDQYFIGNVSRYRDPFMNSKTRMKVLTWGENDSTKEFWSWSWSRTYGIK